MPPHSTRDSSRTLLREFSPVSDAPLRFAGRSHVGRRGGENEDALGWDVNLGVWLIADGMGGHVAGKVASAIAKDAFLARVTHGSLQEAVNDAHGAVVAAAAADPALRGMGTTLVAARITGDLCSIVWVGDSRAYLLRRGRLRALTRDHSFLESLRDRRNLSEAELHAHPDRNLVTQSLGLGTPVPSAVDAHLRNGDRIVLCSDGLNDELVDAEIAAVLRTQAPPDAAADALIAAALDHGGRDNVTVIVIDYDENFAVGGAARAKPRSRWRRMLLGGACLLLVLAAIWWYVIAGN